MTRCDSQPSPLCKNKSAGSSPAPTFIFYVPHMLNHPVTISAPIKNLPYSKREITFPSQPTSDEIQEVVALFAKIEAAFNGVKTQTASWPAGHVPVNIQLLQEENAQLKEFQDKTMQLLEIIKTTSPDVYDKATAILATNRP